MIIGDHIRGMCEEKKFSQGDIEKRTGLLRCYIFRVENGHTVPASERLEKIARALECPWPIQLVICVGQAFHTICNFMSIPFDDLNSDPAIHGYVHVPA